MVTIAQFISDQYPATDETQCITLYIPAGDEFKALAAGLLALASNPLNYDEPDSAQAEGLAAVWDDAYSIIDWDGCQPLEDFGMASEVNLWAHEAIVQYGNPIVPTTITVQMHNLIGAQNPASLGSRAGWHRCLAAGEWAFSYLYRRLSNGGIIDITVEKDGGSPQVILNNFDTRGTTLENQFARGTFTLAESGVYYIYYDIVGTSSGSNYGNTFTLLQMWRTSPPA